MSEIIFLVEESPEGGFTARSLTDAIYTQADTMEQLREMIKDAVHCHFDDTVKRVIRLHIVKEEVIAA
jgi:predicted RNase H-like HicB family nuclease